MILNPGDLISVKSKFLNMMQDGFSTGGSWIEGHIELYEWIDLETFPSLDDFQDLPDLREVYRLLVRMSSIFIFRS